MNPSLSRCVCAWTKRESSHLKHHPPWMRFLGNIRQNCLGSSSPTIFQWVRISRASFRLANKPCTVCGYWNIVDWTNHQSTQFFNPSELLAKLTYAAPAWIGFANQGEIDRIDSFLRKCVRFNFAPPDQVSFRDLVESHEEKLFNAIISNPDHVLYSLLPPKKKTTYNMRKRAHDFVIPERESKLRDSNFRLRIIHKNSF